MSMDYAGSITLDDVKQNTFRNLKTAHRFALDIGGSLAKIAYQSKRKRRRTLVRDSPVSESAEPLRGSISLYDRVDDEEVRECLHFVKFETRYLEECLDFIHFNLLNGEKCHQSRVKVTGGGAYKYRDMIKEKLSMELDKEDEMECLIRGCVFLLQNIRDEVFSFDKLMDPCFCFQPPGFTVEGCFPFLLVNIGSGVSVLKVESETKYSRIGGTSLGGGTFWGIGSLIAKIDDFDKLLEVAEKGDHRQVDMLVGDIYGGGYDALGLGQEVIASSFGKAARKSGVQIADSGEPAQDGKFRVEDLVKSLLITVSNNIGQIAFLLAKAHGLKKIIFGGYFIRGHPTTMHTLTYAINFWSKGEMQALFLRHEGYLGAIGAFLKGAEEEAALPSAWAENFYGCTAGLSLSSRPRGLSFDHLELDPVEDKGCPFALLADPLSYKPDSWDLTVDESARTYWLQCFKDGSERHAKRAAESQSSVPDAQSRAELFQRKFVSFLHEVGDNPCAYGSLTVRGILDAQEDFLREFGFSDPFLEQKRKENEDALECLSGRLEFLGKLSWSERQLELIKGLLTGNIFDWGAAAVAQMLSEDADFGFAKAMCRLQPRPWLFDDFDLWLQRLRQQPSHRCALVFCDNSGFDIIMGVIPLALELLARGTRVVLAVNSGASLNDVTYAEMRILLRRVAKLNEAARLAVKEGRLLVRANGQSSPCLDLLKVSHSLNELVLREGVDLVIIDGMGRALHTNLFAKMSCDCLKVAVIKNSWVCRRLGGDCLFSIVCKFEAPNPP